ncbi:MAG: nSTAND1 domain-containing NTPase [Anaerolineales bacterium]
MAEAYTALEIRVRRYDEVKQSYPVEARLDDGSHYSGGQLKLDRQALLAQLLDAEAYGMTLFNAVFAGDIRRAYDKATGAAEVQSGGRLRVRLWVDDEAVELHALPWERLYHLHKGHPVPLGASALTPLSRYTSLEAREPAAIADTPIRMLVAVSNPLNLPGGLSPANVDVEIDNLRRALSELKKQGQVEVSIMPGRTGLSSTVRGKLEAEGYTLLDGVTSLFNIAPHLAKCHVFHFIGHGAFRRKNERGEGTAALYLEKADGVWQAVRDEEIVSMFTALGTLPHLVFLVACESATREEQAETPFVGLGPKLVQAGVPAVVAMQAQVPVELARLLAGEFYTRLAEHGQVDRALNQARLQVFDAKRTEWAIPVLFMRIRNGHLFGADLDEDAPAPGEPPYKGLEYFGEKDADKFYGREALTAKLVGKLRLSRFLPIIIGASGSGKSSVVRAGLLPALTRGAQLDDGTFPPEGSKSWMTFTLTPGVKPLDALAAALTRDEESATATTTFIDDLAIDKRALHLRSLKLLSRRPDAHRVLVVVDQFEEIFTLTKDESERKAFIDALLYASTEVANGATIVIIIFRADFYAYCAQYANLREAVATLQEFVGPMNKDELRRAIEEPARVNGWDIEPGLVDLILKEVGDEPGALPLMQHALLETWKRRRGRTMTLRGYNDAGGIRGAIAKTAEAIYQALPPEHQLIARRIFLKLVELGEGTQDTRRRAELEELHPRADERPLAESVLKKLVDNRLIVTTDKTAEVAHEALIREWPTYREWVNANRAALKIHRDLTRAAREWESMVRAPEVLLRGIKLLEAREWAEENAAEMNQMEADFLAASREDAEREAHEQETQRQRELEQAKRIAEEQSRAAAAAQQAAESERKRAEEQVRATQRQQLLTRIAAGVGGLALIAAVIAGVFWFQADASSKRAEASAQEARDAQATAVANEQRAIAKEQEADTERAKAETEKVKAEAAEQVAVQQAQLAENRALIAAAYNNLDADPQASLILAQQALAGAAEPAGQREAKEALYQAYEASRLTDIIELEGAGLTLAYNAYDEAWGWLAVGQADGALALFDTADDSFTPRVLAGPPDTLLTTLAFSPDGSRVLAGYDDGTATLWDVEEGEARLTVENEAFVAYVAFEPEGRWFATADYSGVINLWNPTTGDLIQTLSLNDIFFDLLAVSPDGELLAGADSYAGQVFIYRLRSGEFVSTQPALTLTGAEQLTTMAFAPDSQLATASADAQATLWDLPGYFAARDAGRATSTDLPASKDFIGHAADITSIAFSPDGAWMATASLDWQVNVWDVRSSRNLYTLTGHQGAVYAVTFAGPARLATTSLDGTLRLWWGDLSGGVNGLDFGSPVISVLYGPGDRLAIGTKDGRVVVGSLVEEYRMLGQHERSVTELAYNLAGDRLVSASEDGQAIVWEVSTGASLLTLSHGLEFPIEISAMAYSPDGQWIATGAEDGTVQIWNGDTGDRVIDFDTTDPRVTGLAFSRDGARLAVATDFGSVIVFDRETGERTYELVEHFGAVNAMAFSLDDRFLASADDDGQIVIWDMATGNRLTRIGAHAGQVFGLEFTATALASIGTDRSVKFWDLVTWKETLTVAGSASVGNDLSISPNGQELAVAGVDGVVRFYPLDGVALAENVHAAIHRALSLEECERYRLAGDICQQP